MFARSPIRFYDILNSFNLLVWCNGEGASHGLAVVNECMREVGRKFLLCGSGLEDGWHAGCSLFPNVEIVIPR